ncbi:MAG: hypothetical protein EA358_00975 [Flavobacteriales bacterium]|nr:MAG: hypothetical protein EA358_00975 [Flavobacteriales bacterium]
MSIPIISIFWAPYRAFRCKSSAKTAVSASAGKELLRRSYQLASTGVLASGLSASIAGAAPREMTEFKVLYSSIWIRIRKILHFFSDNFL